MNSTFSEYILLITLVVFLRFNGCVISALNSCVGIDSSASKLKTKHEKVKWAVIALFKPSPKNDVYLRNFEVPLVTYIND